MMVRNLNASLFKSPVAATVVAATAVFGFFITCGSAQAALTYVDATNPGNTALDASFAVDNANNDDDLWTERTGFASSGNVFESGVGDGEDAPEIFTTLSGLDANSNYRVYVHFWDGSGSDPDWNVRAGFASGSTTIFANPADAADIGATDAALASDLLYDSAPTTFQEADRTMYAGLVGIGPADGNGNLVVYIDDLPSTIGVNQRSWYDGVSYELIPEPSSLVLLLTAALAGLIRANRRMN
jgi:hypothetical protein